MPMRAARLASKAADEGTWLEIHVDAGPARDMRRALGALGHPVRRSRRVGYGPLELADLAEGSARQVSESERLELRELAGSA